MPRVFISYAMRDEEAARRLRDELEPADLDVFADPWIEPSEHWSTWTTHESTDLMVVLLSPDALSSPWGRLELGMILERNRLEGTPVLPVIVRPVTELPYGLQQVVSLNMLTTESAREVAAQIAAAAERWSLRHASWAVSDLRRLCRDFFAEARGRLPEPPPLVVGDADLGPADIDTVAASITTSRLGYVCYERSMLTEALLTLDEYRARGLVVIPLAGRMMRSALADGRAKEQLNELERLYRHDDNLFDMRNALMDERYLFGREALLVRLVSLLQRSNVLLSGVRKVGKTSLLNILRLRLDDRPVCRIDLERFDRRDPRWPSYLFRDLVASVDRWARSTGRPWPFTTAEVPDGEQLDRALQERSDWLAEAGEELRLVALIDEIERVLPSAGAADEAYHFARAAGALRSVSQAYPGRLTIVAADLRPTVNRLGEVGDETNPWYEYFVEVPVPFLETPAVAEMIESIARAMGTPDVAGRAVERVAALSGGHPWLIRLLAGTAYRRRADHGALRPADVEVALAELDENDAIGWFLRTNLWRPLTGSERAALLAVAAGRKPADRVALGSLVAQGLVRNGQLTCALLGDWLAEEMPQGFPAVTAG